MNDETLHKQLPIGENEKILAVIKHHWFAYASVFIGAGFLCLLVLAGIILVVLGRTELGLSEGAVNSVMLLGLMFMAVIAGFSFVPVWIKKQEMLVLTEEALLQIKKPSLFASKVSQLNLQHVADVTVNQDTVGSLFGFARLTIETPGEQDNYEFSVVANAREQAKQISEAHENYAAALESGQIQTTLGQRAPVPGSAWREAPRTPQGSNNSVQPSDESSVPPPPDSGDDDSNVPEPPPQS